MKNTKDERNRLTRVVDRLLFVQAARMEAAEKAKQEAGALLALIDIAFAFSLCCAPSTQRCAPIDFFFFKIYVAMLADWQAAAVRICN